MKKVIAFLMIFALLLALCACGKTTVDPTEVSVETVTPGNAGEVTPGNISDILSTQNAAEVPTTSTPQTGSLPPLEDYTLVAEQTKNKNSFVFADTKEAVLTCNKAVFINSDGTTEMSFSFAEDGSGITMQSLNPDGVKNTTLIEFDTQGRVIAIFNGSGSYSTYTYENQTCVLQAFDAEGVLLDLRTYFYDENGRTQRVERADDLGVYEAYFYFYKENGLNDSMRVENESGYVLYVYDYDENDNLVSNRIEQNGEFYALQKYTYDEHGKRVTQDLHKDENAPHMLDVHLTYSNEYSENGLYIGTIVTNTSNGKVSTSVSYGYVTTQYPHYAEFIETHFMTY